MHYFGSDRSFFKTDAWKNNCITELQITNTFKALKNWPAACQKLVSLGEGANQLCRRLCWFKWEWLLRLIDLNIWSPVGRIVLERIRRCGEGVSLGDLSFFLIIMLDPVSLSLLWACGSGVSYCSRAMPACLLMLSPWCPWSPTLKLWARPN